MNKSIKALIVFLCVLCGMIVMLSCEENTAKSTDELALTEPIEKKAYQQKLNSLQNLKTIGMQEMQKSHLLN